MLNTRPVRGGAAFRLNAPRTDALGLAIRRLSQRPGMCQVGMLHTGQQRRRTPSQQRGLHVVRNPKMSTLLLLTRSEGSVLQKRTDMGELQ